MSCTTADTTNDVAVWLYRGDTMRLLVELRDASGAPVDITGWTFVSQLRPTADDPSSVPIAITVNDPTSGSLQLELAPVVTAALTVRDYAFDVEATDTTDDVKTLIVGQLRVKEDVSR